MKGTKETFLIINDIKLSESNWLENLLLPETKSIKFVKLDKNINISEQYCGSDIISLHAEITLFASLKIRSILSRDFGGVDGLTESFSKIICIDFKKVVMLYPFLILLQMKDVIEVKKIGNTRGSQTTGLNVYESRPMLLLPEKKVSKNVSQIINEK